MPLSDKKLEKLHKILGTRTADLDAMSSEELKNQVLGCEQELKKVTDELEANEEYVAAKEVIKDLRSGLAPVKKEMRAVIEYSLHNLEEKGQ